MNTSSIGRVKTSRRTGGAPTISDVARLAGVSPMTVSRVINGTSNVRAATRDAVTHAIATLNYAPNPAARSLAGAGQVRIGLLYSNPSAGFLSEFLLGSLEHAPLGCFVGLRTYACLAARAATVSAGGWRDGGGSRGCCTVVFALRGFL